MDIQYYGEYRSGNSGSIGCINSFMTRASSTPLFPPQVELHCNLCNKVHSFYFYTSHMASTKSQIERVEQYCDVHGVQRDVKIAE